MYWLHKDTYEVNGAHIEGWYYCNSKEDLLHHDGDFVVCDGSSPTEALDLIAQRTSLHTDYTNCLVYASNYPVDLNTDLRKVFEERKKIVTSIANFAGSYWSECVNVSKDVYVMLNAPGMVGDKADDVVVVSYDLERWNHFVANSKKVQRKMNQKPSSMATVFASDLSSVLYNLSKEIDSYIPGIAGSHVGVLIAACDAIHGRRRTNAIIKDVAGKWMIARLENKKKFAKQLSGSMVSFIDERFASASRVRSKS